MLSSHRVLNFTKITLFILTFFVQITVKAWDVDFSRRQKDTTQTRGPLGVVDDSKPENIVNSFFESMGPSQEIVILNTEKGFVPETIRLKKGGNYKFHIVNVNEKEKNVSFILDAFSEHHGTYFGLLKSFSINPKIEGIYSFQCPETAKQGRVIIFADEARKPASKK